MAPKGLETVRQKFEADNAAYIESIKEMIEYNDLFIDSIRLVQEQIKGIGKALGDIDSKEIRITVDAKQALAEIAKVKAELAGLGDKTVHIRAVSDALGDMGDTASDTADAVRDIGSALGGDRGGGYAPGSGGFLGGRAKEINDAMAGIKDQVDALLASQGKATAGAKDQGNAVRGLTGDIDKATLAAQRFSDTNARSFVGFERQANTVKHSMLDMITQMERLSRNIGGGAEELIAGKILAGRFQSSLDESRFNAALSDMFGPAGGAAPGGSGGPAGSAADQIAAARALGTGPDANESARIAAVAAAIRRGAGGAGAGAMLAALGDMLGGGAAAGGGGGLGGLGGFGGFFAGGGRGPEFDPKTAAGKFANVAAFVGRWYPAAHWLMMLGNELLATAGPAAVALGGAALVGTEGAQQIANRYQALSAVQESIGAATGQSIATFLNVPNRLQQLQSQYGSGEVYGIAGAGINALRTGGGNAFLQLGQNTLQMISGAAADFVLAMKGGLGTAVSSIVQGGTGYAQQFGDTLGNIGKTLVNVAKNAPGVGAMLLTTLQATTGGISDVTKALGPGLLPLLGFEAGARYGPPIIGGAGALLQNFLPFGLGGKLPTVAHAATAAEAAASGGKLAIGDLVGGTKGAGIAGLLGGLTAAEIGALAIATIAITKGLTGKTAEQQKYAGLATSMTGANLVGNLSQIAGAAFPGGGLPPVQPGSAWDANLSVKQFGGIIGGGAAQWGKAFLDMNKQFGLGVGDIFTGQWSKALHSVGNIWQDLTSPGGLIHGLGQMLGIVGPPPSPAQAALQQMSTAFGTWTNMLGAAGQVKDIWKNMGSGALSTSAALDVLAQSGVNINTAFKANGELTAKANQQIQNYVAGYQAMSGTVPGGAAGGTLAAINAVSIAGGLQASKLATVNAAFDQVTQITAGGAAGTGAFVTLLGTMNTLGATIAAAPPVDPAAVKKNVATIAQALTNVTTPSGAAAWTAFASTTQPSVISQLSAQTDSLRTMQQLGGFGAGGATQANMAKYLIGQALPYAARSPAALSTLSTVAQQYGMAPFTPGESVKQMDQAFQQFLKGGDTAKQYNQALNAVTQRVSSIPADAKTFITAASGTSQSALAAATDLYGAQVQQQFMAAAGGGKGIPPALSKQYAGILAAAGFTPGGAGAAAEFAAYKAGAPHSALAGIAKQISQQVTIDITPHVKMPALQKFTPPTAEQVVKIKEQVQKTAIPKPPDQSFQIRGQLHMPVIPKVADQSFNIIGHVSITGAGMASIAGAGGTRLHAQSGFKIPGYGGGDIWGPAMLEPGELIVPKHMVAAGFVDHLRGRIPGFQSGGVIDVPSFAGGPGIRAAFEDIASQLMSFMAQGFAGLAGSLRGGTGGVSYAGGPPVTAGTPVPVHIVSVAPPAAVALGGSSRFPGAAGPMPAAANKVIDAFEKTFKNMPGPWNLLASQILAGLLAGVKNSTKETAAMATTLVNKVKTEIAFGQGVTSTAVQGLNFGGMQVPAPAMTAQGKPYQYYIDQQNIAAGGQPGSVQEQMGSYLQALRSFQGDMGALAKGGLEKRLMQQLYAAGPVQGDALAQSILGGPGGIKAANQLYNQINSAATKLGVSAIGNVYGQPAGKTVHAGATVTGAAQVHALQSAINSLHGKTVTVSVNVTTGGGAASLSKAQMTQVTKQVRADILQQAKRNRSSALTLQGYGS